MKRIFLVAGIILFFQYCNTSTETVYPFRNPDLSIEDRVNDLMDRLTLAEKIGQLNY